MMHKLVRNKLPIEDAIRHGYTDQGLDRLLAAKLVEEAREYADGLDTDEIADVLEVIDTIARARGISLVDLHRMKDKKADARGRFDKPTVIIDVMRTRCPVGVGMVSVPAGTLVRRVGIAPQGGALGGSAALIECSTNGGKGPFVRATVSESVLAEPDEAIDAPPRVGIAAAVVNASGGILFGRRTKDPYRGSWVLPGGRIERGETFHQALARELREETNLVLERIVGEPVVCESFVGESSGAVDHRIIIFVRAAVTGWEARAPGDDLDDFLVTDAPARDADAMHMPPAVRRGLRALGLWQ